MPGGAPGFFIALHLDADPRAISNANFDVHVDYHRFPSGRDGRATARERVIDEPAKQRRSAPILSEDRGFFFITAEDEHDDRRGCCMS